MVGCAAFNCQNRTEDGFQLFRFPADELRREQWIINCQRTGSTLASSSHHRLCNAHFDENQFEQHREDGWKKLKPNAIPTVFPEPIKKLKKKSLKKKRQKSSQNEEKESMPKKRKTSQTIKQETPEKSQANSTHKKDLVVVVKLPHGTNSGLSSKYRRDNVSPRLRKSPRPSKCAILPDSDLSSELDVDDDEDEEEEFKPTKYQSPKVSSNKVLEMQQQISTFKTEIESLSLENSEFEKHNKAMTKVIFELEKHNKMMSVRIIELEKENKVLNFKITDLEKLNEDLKSKLDSCFTEEQLARMDKMRQLGTIERYIPAFK